MHRVFHMQIINLEFFTIIIFFITSTSLLLNIIWSCVKLSKLILEIRLLFSPWIISFNNFKSLLLVIMKHIHDDKLIAIIGRKIILIQLDTSTILSCRTIAFPRIRINHSIFTLNVIKLFGDNSSIFGISIKRNV